jgi:hypothetical protein
MSFEYYSSGTAPRCARSLHGPTVAKLLPWFLSAALLTGCARRYDILLTDGTRVRNVTRPVKNKDTGMLNYKTVDGTVHSKSAARVVEIVPHSDKIAPPGSFSPSGS